MLTNDQKQMIRIMRGEGVSFTQISKKLQLSRNTIKSFCQRKNILGQQDLQKLCRNCGQPLQFCRHKKFFCSDQCRTKWWNQNKLLTCQYCGKSFLSNGNKHRKFCGRDCYLRGRYGKGLP